MKILRSTMLLALLSVLSLVSTAQNVTVLGYFPQYRNPASFTNYDKITDIVFSFINPNWDGTLKQSGYSSDAVFGFDMNKFITVRDAAANNNVKLWIALGGADAGHQRDARLNSVSGNATYRSTLAQQIVDFAIQHGCYGIAVDWEFPDPGQEVANHLALMQEIKAKINASSNTNLKTAVAVGGEYKNTVNHLNKIDASLFTTNANLVDYWHVMAYDFPASYATNHSTLADGQGSMEGWNAKGMAYNKMLLGVPFYGRTANRSGEIEYNNLSGSAATNYTNDNNGTYYYNGKTTLEAKIDLAVNKGAPGILIWDLGQDRTDQYSLLGAIDAKVQTVCPVTKPNLGPDKGVCSPNTIVLDPQVSGSGITYKWYKDNVVMNGETGATLTVGSAGTYKVEVTKSGCTKEDEIVIASGSPLTTTGASGCNDVQLTLSVNNPDGAKTYEWYDAASGGTKVGTGTSISQVFPTTTTYYVEEKAAGVNSYTTTPDDATNYAWSEKANWVPGQRLVADADLTIKSLRILASANEGITFKVKVVKSVDNSTVTEAGPFTVAPDANEPTWQKKVTDVTTNIVLSAGSYFVYPEITSGNLAYELNNTNENSQASVYTLKKAMYRDFGSGFQESEENDAVSFVHYGPFFKWVIETGANASCGRTAATATVQQCGPPSVTINNPTSAQEFDLRLVTNAQFDADISDEGTISSVVFEVLNSSNQVVQTITTSNSGTNYNGTVDLSALGVGDYTLRVKATDNDNNTTTETVAFKVVNTTGVAELDASQAKVFPVPSNTEFTLQTNGLENYNVFVYDLNGKVVYNFNNVNENTLTFGKELTAGTYVISVISNQGVYQTQLIKK